MSEEPAVNGQKRVLPSAEVVEAELHRRFTMRQKPVKLTFEMKTRKPSALKRSRAIKTASFITNLKSQVLEHYKEDCTNPRPDGAVVLVLSLEGSATHRSNIIGDQTYSEFARHLPDARRFASRSCQGACRTAATVMIKWVQDIAAFIERREAPNHTGKRRKKPSDVLADLTVKAFYEGWQRQAQRYEEAAQTVIPFGRHKGVPIGEIGRREARWLISRLLPKAELERTLAFVEQLLEKRSVTADDALFAGHPYKFDERHRRSLQASRLVQRVLDPIDTSEPVLLGLLDTDELSALRKELQEQLATGAVLDEQLVLSELQEVLTETIATSESFETLQEAFEVFLYGKPMEFPAIPRVDIEGGFPIEAVADYKRSLNWFRPNLDRLGDAEKYISATLEARARDNLERASGRLRAPKLQPIPFIGTIKPSVKKPSFRDCALLFDEETHEYVFVAMLRGEDDPLTKEEIEQRKAIQKSAARWGKLRYANFPLHQFQMPERAALEIYPLEWGEASARKRFLRKRAPILKGLIDNQRRLQQELFQTARLKGLDEEEALQESLVLEPVFTTARLIVRAAKSGKSELFVQITVTPPEAEKRTPASTIIGIHEHLSGYSYAIIGLDGQPVRGPDGNELVGDVAVPAHVDPNLKVKKSKNFPHEVANALLRQGGDSLVALEDTSYRKAQSELSRERNRAIFQRPSKLIRAHADYKARLIGLPTLLIQNVSPSRDCSGCGGRLPEGESAIRVEVRVRCPQCLSQCSVSQSSNKICCPECQHTWNPTKREQQTNRFFACPTCLVLERPARYNTAIVVAQETLRVLQRLSSSGSAEHDAE